MPVGRWAILNLVALQENVVESVCEEREATWSNKIKAKGNNYNWMFRLKTESGLANLRKLEIKIPNFSHFEEKDPKSSHRYHLRSHTQPNKQSLQSKHPPLPTKQFSPTNINTTRARVIKLKWDSKSPKTKCNSPGGRQAVVKRPADAKDNVLNTCRSIQDVKKKLVGYRVPMKLSNKYFKKEGINEKLQDMNKTLKKMAEQKRKPRYQLRMLKKLGKSQTGDIILALSNINNMIVAIKTFHKEKIRLQFLIEQMKIHLYCRHPNILPAYGFHIGRQEVYLVMEYGYHNLYEEILKTGPFEEDKAADYIAQILSGIDYLHRNGVMHRDLKPENVICIGGHLKITDFGWSIKTDKQRKTLCGTLDYLSPEVANKSLYDNKIDCWSVGVLLYEMLMVQPPFPQATQECRFQALVLPPHLSLQCRDLLSQLLEVDAKKRVGARQALEHPWIKQSRNCSIKMGKKQLRELQHDLDKLFKD